MCDGEGGKECYVCMEDFKRLEVGAEFDGLVQAFGRSVLARTFADYFRPTHSNLQPHVSSIVNHQRPIAMSPKKKVERAAQENISLGPQVREGLFATHTHTLVSPRIMH